MKRIFALTLAAVLLFALCPAFSGMRAEAETAKEAEKAPVEVPVEGEYTLFTMELLGRQTDPALMGMGGSIILLEGGKGRMVSGGAEQDLAKWTLKDGKLTLVFPDDTEMEAVLRDGVIEMETGPGTNAYIYFAHEDADTKDFKTSGHPTDSRLYTFVMSLDPGKGVHLSYQYRIDSMDSDSVFDAHAKGESYYVLETTKVKGYSSDKATLYKDGTVYLLNPDKKTGSELMSVSAAMLGGNILMADKLYQVLSTRFMRTDFKEEERELDGVTYQVEVFPEEDYTEEAAFYFDGDGQLVHILVGAPKLMPSLGETFYTVGIPDDRADESLFEIKDYRIVEK